MLAVLWNVNPNLNILFLKLLICVILFSFGAEKPAVERLLGLFFSIHTYCCSAFFSFFAVICWFAALSPRTFILLQYGADHLDLGAVIPTAQLIKELCKQSLRKVRSTQNTEQTL